MFSVLPLPARGSRTPQSGFSSRRTLLKSLTPPKKVISVPKVSHLSLFVCVDTMGTSNTVSCKIPLSERNPNAVGSYYEIQPPDLVVRREH